MLEIYLGKREELLYLGKHTLANIGSSGNGLGISRVAQAALTKARSSQSSCFFYKSARPHDARYLE